MTGTTGAAPCSPAEPADSRPDGDDDGDDVTDDHGDVMEHLHERVHDVFELRDDRFKVCDIGRHGSSMRGQSQQQRTRAVDGRSAPANAVESASGGTLLQISTGVYFDGDCYETLHRAVYFTNLMRGTADDLSLPVGELQFSTDGGSVMISATDRLPKYDGNGEVSPHVATGGIELLDDVADVVAFMADAIVVRDPDQARRLIRDATNPGNARSRPRLRRTQTPFRYLSADDGAEISTFMTQLIAMQRPAFDRAMRSIRRVVDAAILADSDAALSYSLFVAALESLAVDVEAAPATWNDYDSKKRVVIDRALAGLSNSDAERIQTAVLQADALQLRRKFQTFVLQHVDASFYRDEAVEATRPIRSVDLPNALNFAYQARSKSLHEMRALAPELWLLAGSDDTARIEELNVLSLEGLNRLCRHVIRNYVRRATPGVDRSFNWRSVLPGVVRVPLSPVMWLPGYDLFDAAAGSRLFSAVVELFTESAGTPKPTVVDMRTPLRRIEALLAGESKVERRRPLIAAYMLWHRLVVPDLKLLNHEAILDKFHTDLEGPHIETLVLSVLFNVTHTWSRADLFALAGRRLEQLRQRKTPLELPARFDSAIQLVVADAHWTDGDRQQARSAIAVAVELDPGNAALIELERAAKADTFELPPLMAYIANGTFDAAT